MNADSSLLEALPVAIYTTDAEGRIAFFNAAAAVFWGRRPVLGVDRWCGSLRLYWPDGRPMAHDECPMAATLREGRPVRGAEAVAERPDGTRVPFMPYPTLLRDESGRVTGAVNLLFDLTDRAVADADRARLAAIVSSSDDAIVSKTLDGRITSWNASATRLFGWAPEEAIGQSITLIVPIELRDQEAEILARLRRGERIDHFDTVRVAKDGRRIDVSLTVSPLRDRTGRVVGASKIARDISERKQSEELQRLLFDELNHRVKNMLATIQAIASQSLSTAVSPGQFVTAFGGRLQALARAHDLLVQRKMQGADVMEIVHEQVVLGTPETSRVTCSGPLLMLDPRTAVQLALVLHELATNARKYGALSVADGRLSIEWKLRMRAGRELLLEWKESGVAGLRAPSTRGFGTKLIERSFEGSGGEASIRYGADGVVCEIRLPLPDAGPHVLGAAAAQAAGSRSAQPGPRLDGRRVLLIEDEALIAMEIEAELSAAGCTVVGPAGTVEEARRLIAERSCDAALVDANLGGHPVDELAAALTRKGIPFAFATGYGRNALPSGFEDAPVLSKPFSPGKLRIVVGALLGDGKGLSEVVPLRPKRR